MKKTAGFFIAENLKNPLMGKRNQNACVMRAKITYTQKQTKLNSGQMNGQCGGFIRLLLTAYSFSELEVSVKCLLPIS